MTNTIAPEYIGLLKRVLTASIYDESAWRLVEGPRMTERGIVANLKRAVIRILKKRGIRIVREVKFSQEKRDRGLDWPMFGFTMVGTKRLENLQNCVDRILSGNIPGDFVETGVWRGGSCIFVKALFNHYGVDRLVWCCDSFEGMPEPRGKDLQTSDGDYRGISYLAASQEQVVENFERFGLLDEKVKFIKGWFNQSLPEAPIDKIAILRLDGDHYSSTTDALKALYHKVSPGGFIIIDDYKTWEGCRLAVSDFRSEHRITNPIEDIDGSAVFWRVSPA